ncbi:hypothetical protein OOT46_25350 [Aquabacterium sp. A7-Y]|uniref:calcium-binding protein n=1 Tax=Aquabacterium sp. A7-Y TaxID=1349605 RepID=UPI00223E2EE6|nr:hypothetical protein [Aquabacterium sp. A7-Y]MCW7541144.1 hypothetical protein [Aquabacterium sp. A7-Y]
MAAGNQPLFAKPGQASCGNLRIRRRRSGVDYERTPGDNVLDVPNTTPVAGTGTTPPSTSAISSSVQWSCRNTLQMINLHGGNGGTCSFTFNLPSPYAAQQVAPTLFVPVYIPERSGMVPTTCLQLLKEISMAIITGTLHADVLPGTATYDEIFGLDGDDLLNANWSDGDDIMIGGPGNDVYCVNSVENRVVEDPNQGVDRVVSRVLSYTLGNNVENLLLDTAGPAIKGFGNAMDNFMIGNNANNTLAGGDGNDRLDGGDGNDWLGGEGGNDGIGGGKGDDTLVGGNGDDSIFGDSGNDVLNGDDGADRLDGAVGNDTVQGPVRFFVCEALKSSR